MRKQFNLQLFAAPTNTTVTTDLEPGISIDYTSRISSNINELQDLLGVTELTPMSSGTTIKIYKMEACFQEQRTGHPSCFIVRDNYALL